jgi:allantoate deiminase
MHLRRDPFLAGAEIALDAERVARALPNAVATVGQVLVQPGAANVIPGQVILSLDMRAQDDDIRRNMVEEIENTSHRIAAARGVEIDIAQHLDVSASHCAPWLVEQIEAAVRESGVRPLRLPSGAGHDGMAMIGLTAIGMIFVRCKGGISHSPRESVRPDDVAVAAETLLRLVKSFTLRVS